MPRLVLNDIARDIAAIYADARSRGEEQAAEAVGVRLCTGLEALGASPLHSGAAMHLVALLVEHPDVTLRRQRLWYCWACITLRSQLPAPVGSALRWSHLRLLVHVSDPELTQVLARQAVEEGLSKRALNERIVQATGATARRGRRGGRRRTPRVVLELDHAVQSLERAVRAPVDIRELSRHGVVKVRRTVERVRRAREQLDGLIGELEELCAPSSEGVPPGE